MLCELLVEAYCLLSSEKKERNTECCGHGSVDEFISICGNALKFSNAVPSIYTDIFPP